MRIRDLEERDLTAVEAILREWLMPPEGSQRMEEEIAGRLVHLRESLVSGSSRSFVVADLDGEVIGIMGVQTEGIAEELLEAGERAAELISAFVRRDVTGRGVGRRLAEEIEARARRWGADTLVVVSGARHRERGYPFWTARYGPAVRRDEDFWAPGAERVVWRAPLAPA